MDASSPDDIIETKGAFAERINVSAGRVSQYIAAGQIGPDALEGTGRNARVRVARAMTQLGLRLDIGQRLGNGLGTRLAPAPPIAPASPEREAPVVVPTSFEARIQAEKLEEMQRRNRKGAEEEAARAGTFVETGATRQQMTRIAIDMMGVFEGGLPEMATALSARFEIPQRDALHLLRIVMRGIREKAAEQAKRHALSVPRLVEVETDYSEEEAA